MNSISVTCCIKHLRTVQCSPGKSWLSFRCHLREGLASINLTIKDITWFSGPSQWHWSSNQDKICCLIKNIQEVAEHHSPSWLGYLIHEIWPLEGVPCWAQILWDPFLWFVRWDDHELDPFHQIKLGSGENEVMANPLSSFLLNRFHGVSFKIKLEKHIPTMLSQRLFCGWLVCLAVTKLYQNLLIETNCIRYSGFTAVKI